MSKHVAVASVRVRCSGQIHEIILTDHLEFVLKNHTKKQIEAEKVESIITKRQVPKCLLLLEKLRAQDIRKPSLYQRVKNLPKPIKDKLLEYRPSTYKYRGSILNSKSFSRNGKPFEFQLFIGSSWSNSRISKLLDRLGKRKQLRISYLSAALPPGSLVEKVYILLRYRILECPELKEITYWTDARVCKIDDERLLLVTITGPTRAHNYYVCERSKVPEPIDDKQGKRLDDWKNSRFLIKSS